MSEYYLCTTNVVKWRFPRQSHSVMHTSQFSALTNYGKPKHI